jgi:hypothetical protein
MAMAAHHGKHTRRLLSGGAAAGAGAKARRREARAAATGSQPRAPLRLVLLVEQPLRRVLVPAQRLWRHAHLAVGGPRGRGNPGYNERRQRRVFRSKAARL